MKKLARLTRDFMKSNRLQFFRFNFSEQLQQLKDITESDDIQLYFFDELNTVFLYPNGTEAFSIPSGAIERLATVTAAKKTPVTITEDDVNVDPLGERQKRCLFSVPMLKLNGSCLGVLVMSRYGENAYSNMIQKYVLELSSWIWVSLEQDLEQKERSRVYYFCDHLAKHATDYLSGCNTFSKCLYLMQELAKHVILVGDFIFFEIDSDAGEAIVFKETVNKCMENINTIRFLKGSIEYKAVFDKQWYTGVSQGIVIDPHVASILNYHVEELICAPILLDTEVVAVIELINKQSSNKSFDEMDLECFAIFSQFLGIIMKYKHHSEHHAREVAKAEQYTEIFQNQLLHRDVNLLEQSQSEINFKDFEKYSWYASESNCLNFVLKTIIKKANGNFFPENQLDVFLVSLHALHKRQTFYDFLFPVHSLHFIYYSLQKISKVFSANEIAGLLLASLMYYADYVIYDEPILKRLNHPISRAYKEVNCKTMHRIDLFHFLMMRSNLLDHLPVSDREEILKVFESITRNISMYNKNTKTFQREIENCSDMKKYRNRLTILTALFWFAKHSYYLKPLHFTLSLIENLYIINRFERHEIDMLLGILPLETKDPNFRNQAMDFEVGYMNNVLPIFHTICRILPPLQEVVDNIDELYKGMKDAISLRESSTWKPPHEYN